MIVLVSKTEPNRIRIFKDKKSPFSEKLSLTLAIRDIFILDLDILSSIGPIRDIKSLFCEKMSLIQSIRDIFELVLDILSSIKPIRDIKSLFCGKLSLTLAISFAHHLKPLTIEATSLKCKSFYGFRYFIFLHIPIFINKFVFISKLTL